MNPDTILPEIARAWEQYVISGVLDNTFVRPEIGQSWIRCRNAQVDAYKHYWQVLDDDQLAGILQHKKVLLEITMPVMQNLYSFVAGTGFVVMLADENGYILEILGDPETLAHACEINLVKGSCWREQVTGTNGVGTALALHKPVQVSGEEHYCQAFHGWTCSAALIYDCESSLTGVLQMSGPSQLSHRHTLGMVVAAVAAIEEQLKVRKQSQELKLTNKRMHNIFLTMSEGVIIIDGQGRIVEVNPVSENILGETGAQLQQQPVCEVFPDMACISYMLTSGKPFRDLEVNTDLKRKSIHCLASGKAIKDGHGKINGGVIILSPIKKIKKLVNRFSGAQARFTFDDIIGKSENMQEAVRVARMAALNESNVLLQGESGTGKEVFAQAIHNASSRHNGPFVALNCAAIPRDLMGSELFGYVEGAFTGAQRGGRPGKFELASGGTLFLDEIGDMTMGKQGALLRAIQEKAIVRIGDDRVIPVDARIICATNKNLQEAVKRGEFRRDLFYRLNVLSINLPPLREHSEDIPALFNYFVEQVSRRLNIEIEYISPDISNVLSIYPWHGNTRELENVVERMVCMAKNHRLGLEDLPAEIINFTPEAGGPKENIPEPDLINITVSEERKNKKTLKQVREKQLIIELLAKNGGNISRVARDMGVARNTVYRKLKQYNINI